MEECVKGTEEKTQLLGVDHMQKTPKLDLTLLIGYLTFYSRYLGLLLIPAEIIYNQCTSLLYSMYIHTMWFIGRTCTYQESTLSLNKI